MKGLIFYPHTHEYLTFNILYVKSFLIVLRKYILLNIWKETYHLDYLAIYCRYWFLKLYVLLTFSWALKCIWIVSSLDFDLANFGLYLSISEPAVEFDIELWRDKRRDFVVWRCNQRAGDDLPDLVGVRLPAWLDRLPSWGGAVPYCISLPARDCIFAIHWLVSRARSSMAS